MKSIYSSKIIITAILVCCSFLLTQSKPCSAQPGLPIIHVAPPAVVATGKVIHAAPPAVLPKAQPQAAQAVYSHGDPTAEEQYLLELINRGRANPAAEGDRLSTTTDPTVTSSYDYFGSPTRAQVKSDFATYPAQPPLAFNSKLSAAAKEHSQDMLDHDYQDHTGTDGTSPFDRMHQAGYSGTYMGENIYAYGKAPWDIHASFQIDFGNPGLGHRENIMNFQTGGAFYTEIGISIIHGSGAHVGPLVTTEDFGDAGQNFILGVVYDDQNHNGFYDIGEGLAGVTISVSTGGFTAVSSKSGGYAIPVSTPGPYTLTVNSPALGGTISHQVTYSSDNIKVDFTKDYSGFPSQPNLVAPVIDSVVHADSASFSWQTVTGATKYHIQIAKDETMSTLVLNDSTLTGLSKKFGPFVSGQTYYWRVRARNAKGWGLYSATQTFSVALPPKPITLVSPADKANTGTTDVTFLWNAAIPFPFDYEFTLATTADLKTKVAVDTVYDSTVVIMSADLAPATTYYWSVRAENENGWSNPSVVRSFTTGGTSSVLLSKVTPSTVTAYPNPTSGLTHIRFSLATPAEVSLKVFNVAGELVSFDALGSLAPNSYDVRWDGSAMSNGTYLYELHVGANIQTGRIILAK
jgi:uncharacterized protein YkwD